MIVTIEHALQIIRNHGFRPRVVNRKDGSEEIRINIRNKPGYADYFMDQFTQHGCWCVINCDGEHLSLTPIMTQRVYFSDE